jgi:hypothetical protein
MTCNPEARGNQMRRTKLRLTIILVLLVTLVSFGHAANADVDAARQPDALTLHPKRPKVVYVATKDRIGSGSNVIELIPMRTVTGERQMVILPAGEEVAL